MFKYIGILLTFLIINTAMGAKSKAQCNSIKHKDWKVREYLVAKCYKRNVMEFKAKRSVCKAKSSIYKEKVESQGPKSKAARRARKNMSDCYLQTLGQETSKTYYVCEACTQKRTIGKNFAQFSEDEKKGKSSKVLSE